MKMDLSDKFAVRNREKTHLYSMMNRYFPKKATVLLVFLFSLSVFTPAQAFEGDAANGKKLYKQNCAACHKLDKKAIGPALGGVTERRTEEWLIAWIRNNAELRASGDADAIAIFEEYNGSIMTAFPSLSDQDIYDILQYTIEGDKPAVPVPDGDGTVAVVQVQQPDYILPMMIVLGALFLLLIALLVKMKNTLRIVQGKDPESIGSEVSAFGRALVANKFIMTVGTIGVGVFFMALVYYYFLGIGVEQNYEPEQPIAFSHAVHAGENKVDCNYCHSTARHSAHSNIPSANVCMNCHKYIDGSEIVDASTGQLKYDGERSPEIEKIYAAIGWDPDEVNYIENYETKPIKWKRIHNLPDLAYFNHAQHVNAGQVECQTCHGPVEEMEVMYQYSTLTMGWCINCHRETKVQTANGYYEGYDEKIMAKYHTEDITVEKIGGLECGKCHY
jgi:mono/diheme cytochrome c family protein